MLVLSRGHELPCLCAAGSGTRVLAESWSGLCLPRDGDNSGQVSSREDGGRTPGHTQHDHQIQKTEVIF